MKKKSTRQALTALAAVVVLVVIVGVLLGSGAKPKKVALSTYLNDLSAGKVRTATIKDKDHVVTGKLTDGSKYRVTFPALYGTDLTVALHRADVHLDASQQGTPWWESLLESLLPLVLLIGAFFYFISSMQGGGSRVMQFGRAKARRANKDQPSVTFADVAGADEAVEELQEIKDFLQNPMKFQAIGAKIPKGVLLYGPPGTGKTLLARAVAGEAGVPFFSISGSDFVEMFVGVGASRVRDLFEQAKATAPAIVFVDEIDAVGRHRGAGLGGGHDEREQTLNQLLVEMDGFDVTSGVILIAATNRPDILDPALLRPGRFDRQIVVDQPDLLGRRAILEVHRKGKPLAADVSLDVVARRTPGFTGADLANLMNESALLTARRGLTLIGMSEVESAIDRVIAGPERRTRVMSDREKRITAYHEAGHALVGHVLPNTDPIHKVSIVARGRALGWTLALPTEDRYTSSRAELRDQLAMLMGGRTAEEMIFGDPTTGAADDIDRASSIARAMVTEYGMSDALGPQKLGERSREVFLGKELGHEANYSDAVAAKIDAEIHALLSHAHAEAREILTQHRTVLDRLADGLVEHETLDEAQLLELFGDLGPWSSSVADASPTPAGGYGVTGADLPEQPLVDLPRIEAAVREILLAIGEDPERDGLVDTPARVARMYAEIFSGLHEDPADHLKVTFEAGHDEMVMVRDIPMYSACEHHMLPWVGKAHVAYIPNDDGRVIGLSKFARLVDGFARRPQVQERLTTQVADALQERLDPKGVMVVIEAEHLCMSMRGVRKPGVITVTSAVRGLFRSNVATREEAMRFVQGR